MQGIPVVLHDSNRSGTSPEQVRNKSRTSPEQVRNKSGTNPEGGAPLPPRRLGDNILAPGAAVEAPRIGGSEGVKEGVRMGAS